jgi:hypothetical protein
MNGFLLNMINRHQGRVDKVQPRIRSMFEPESAPAVATDNAFLSTADTIVKESPDTGFEKQSAFSKSPGIEKSTPDNQPSAPLSVLLHQPAQTDERTRASDLNSLAGNRIDLMNEQIQGLIERFSRKSEPPESISAQNGLQKSALSAATDQSTNKVVSNEIGLTNRIEEALGRLANQTSNAIKTEAEPLNRSIHEQTQTVNAPINSPGGALQIPAWLRGLQTELNNRWQEINTKSQAEPVINVTIGRIEVRAINTEPVKSSAIQGKPKGVLSLDDYLKQRENKGRT